MTSRSFRRSVVVLALGASSLACAGGGDGGSRFQPTGFGGEISLRVSSPAPSFGIVYADAVFYSHHESRQIPYPFDPYEQLDLDKCTDLNEIVEIVEYRDVGPVVGFTSGTASLAAPFGNNGGGVWSYRATFGLDEVPLGTVWTVSAGSAGTFTDTLRLPSRVNASYAGGVVTFDPLGTDRVVVRVQGVDLSFVRWCLVADDGSFTLPASLLEDAPHGYLQVRGINTDFRTLDDGTQVRIIGESLQPIDY